MKPGIAGARRQVHMIDPDESVQDSFRMLGDLVGFDVLSYTSAEGFLSASSGARGHIICAAELPGMSALALFRQLRAQRSDLPFALLIGRDNADLRNAASVAGIHAIVEKPQADAALLEFIGFGAANSGEFTD